MIKTDIDRNYVLIGITDILKFMTSHRESKKIYETFSDIFINYDCKDDCFKLPSTHPAVIYLKKERESKYYIDANTLNIALGIAICENNHEIQKLLTKYIKKYIDNERQGLSNGFLISEIVSNKQLIKYIKKYNNFDEYEKSIIEKSYEKYEKQFSLKKENTSRSKVMM